jgi:hypothetical protein
MSGILGKIEVEALETLYPNRGNVDRIEETQFPFLKQRTGGEKYPEGIRLRRDVDKFYSGTLMFLVAAMRNFNSVY